MKKINAVLLTSLIMAFLVVTQVRAETKPLEGYISGCFAAVGSGHTATLTIKDTAQPNVETWVFACITTNEMGTKCTTGVASIDDSLFNKHDDLTALKGGNWEQVDTGGVDGGGNPRITDASGSKFTQEPLTWSDAYVPGVTHQWSWIQRDVAAGTGGVETGNLGAQQQGTFDFTKLSEDTSKCAKIGWDPRGYVFDVKTLNPVSGISVTISKGPQGGTFTDMISGSLVGLTNPYVTKAFDGKNSVGQYSFYVEPGFYKMRLSSTNATMAKLTDLNPAYHDIFLRDTKTNIYQEGEEVEEVAGTVAIRHIPVNVTNPSLLITSLVPITEFTPMSAGSSINISGRVSHPKSKIIETITVLTEEGVSKEIVRTDITDDLGEYDKDVPQEFIDEVDKKTLLYQSMKVSFELNSFYTTGVFSHNSVSGKALGLLERLVKFIQTKISVNAQASASYVVKPIPSYIEGIAYDSNGMAIPRAIVAVYPFYSEHPMHVTIADDSGRYKIGSQHLPRTTYTLRYKKPTGEVIVVDTGTFIKQNVKLFALEGIKPFASLKTTVAEDSATKALVKVLVKDTDLQEMAAVGLKSKVKPIVKGNPSDSSTNQGNMTNPINRTSITSPGMIMIVVVVLILILIGVGTFIMMKSKQQQTPQF